MPCHHLKYTALACLAVSTLHVANGFCTVTTPPWKPDQAFIDDWMDIGNFVCGSPAGGPPIPSIAAQMASRASAISIAFAVSLSNCQSNGDAEGRAMAFELVEKVVESIGRGVEEALASTDICGPGRCRPALSALAQMAQGLISAAAEEAWTEMYTFSDDGMNVPLSSLISSVVTGVVRNGLTGITDALNAAAGDGCNDDLIIAIQESSFVAECEAPGSPSFDEIGTFAMAEAGARAKEYACDVNIADEEVEIIASGAAQALAFAVFEADGVCEQNGGQDAMSCGLLLPDLSAVIARQAAVFAAAFSEAAVCDCDVSGSGGVEVWLGIWDAAVANAYADTCEGAGEVFLRDIRTEVPARMLAATASAIRVAVEVAAELDGSACRMSPDPCSPDSPDCVRDRNQCGGSGFDHVLPCCGPNHHCVVVNENRFLCRDRDDRIPPFWDGSIAACDLPQ